MQQCLWRENLWVIEVTRRSQNRLNANDFIVADINCDDKAQNNFFYEKFEVKGNTLPSHSGYGEAKVFKDLIRDAKKGQP